MVHQDGRGKEVEHRMRWWCLPCCQPGRMRITLLTVFDPSSYLWMEIAPWWARIVTGTRKGRKSGGWSNEQERRRYVALTNRHGDGWPGQDTFSVRVVLRLCLTRVERSKRSAAKIMLQRKTIRKVEDQFIDDIKGSGNSAAGILGYLDTPKPY